MVEVSKKQFMMSRKYSSKRFERKDSWGDAKNHIDGRRNSYTANIVRTCSNGFCIDLFTRNIV